MISIILSIVAVIQFAVIILLIWEIYFIKLKFEKLQVEFNLINKRYNRLLNLISKSLEHPAKEAE